MANENVTFSKMLRLVPPLEIFDGSDAVPDIPLSGLELLDFTRHDFGIDKMYENPFSCITDTSYPTFNKMTKSAVFEISKHTGINPMYIPPIIPDNMFYDADVSYGGVDAMHTVQKFVNFIYNVILKDAVKSAIEYTANVMPGMFMNISDVTLTNYDYNWKFKLEYESFTYNILNLSDMKCDDILIGMGLNSGMYKKLEDDEIKQVEIILEDCYKNLIKYGFDVVADIKKKLNKGDNGYMPEQMMITRNPNMQQNGQFVVPTAPLFQPMGPEDIAANPDDRLKDQVMQPFVTLVGTAPIYETPANQGTNIQELETDKISERIIHMMA